MDGDGGGGDGDGVDGGDGLYGMVLIVESVFIHVFCSFHCQLFLKYFEKT